MLSGHNLILALKILYDNIFFNIFDLFKSIDILKITTKTSSGKYLVANIHVYIAMFLFLKEFVSFKIMKL